MTWFKRSVAATTREEAHSLKLTHLPFFSFLAWFLQRGYLQGAFWAIMTTLVSNINDVLMKGLGSRLSVVEIIFFRFFFSLITLFPFIVKEGGFSLRMQKPFLHILRALIGVVAIGCSCLAVIQLPLTEVTSLFFTQPLFFLPLAFLFLKEVIPFQRILATLLGFVGILVIVRPYDAHFDLNSLIPIAGALLFAFLDILAKKMVTSETRLSLLFTFALGTTAAAFIPALFFWTTPTLSELFFLFCLGAGANLIQVCLFQAFAATQASALAPFRYVELIFSAFFGFILFHEIPSIYTFMGAVLIIGATLYNTYSAMGISLFNKKRFSRK